MWKQQHIADRGRVGQQHHQAVDTDAFAGGGRHAVLQGAHIVLIVVHGLQISGILFRYLLAEALGLILRVVQLGETVGDLAPADKEFETVGDEGIVVVAPGQG